MLTLAYRIVLGLLLYLPFEDFLLKWLPVSDFAYLALRQIPDLFVLAAVSMVILARVARRGSVRIIGNGADVALAAFIGAAVTSFAFNPASALPALLNLKALLRYVLVVYVLLNVSLDPSRIRYAFRFVMIAVVTQAVVAGWQTLVGPEASRFFLPRVSDSTIGGLQLRFAATWEVEKGWVFGTVGQTVGFAGLMVVGLALWLTTRSGRHLAYWLGAIVLGVLLYLSGSRMALIMGLAVVGVHQLLLGNLGTKLTVASSVLLLAAVTGALMRLQFGEIYLFDVFTERYVEIAMNQRLGVLLIVLPHFIVSGTFAHVLFGFSGDPAVLAGFVSDMLRAPFTLLREINIVEDVYWGALFLYYGVLGFLTFLYFVTATLYSVVRVRRLAPVGSAFHHVATVALLLLLAAFPMNLAGRAFEVRQFAFYLWTMVGLSLACRTLTPPPRRRPETVS